MAAAGFIALLIAAIAYLAVRSENARARQIQQARDKRALLERHPQLQPRDPNEPRDAIPAGYPGFKGSIRYVPYTEDAGEPEAR